MYLSQDLYVCSSPEGMDGPTPTPSPKCSNSNKAHFVHLGATADHEYLLVVICKMGVPKSNKLCPSVNTRKILLLQGCGSEDLATKEAPKSHLKQEG
jgi:hypothetical protein